MELAKHEQRMGDISEEMIDYRGALGHYQKADKHLQATGPVSEERAWVLVDAGNKHVELAEYEAAIGCYKEAWAIFLKEPEKNQAHIAGMLNNIAVVYKDQGNFDEALEYYQKALSIFETLGKNRLVTAMTYNNTAVVYENQGKLDEALDYYKKALPIFEALGKNHPLTAGIYNNFGEVCRKQGKFDEALKWYQKNLAITEKMPGKNHPDTAKTYGNIAVVYKEQGKLDEALELCKKALTVFEEKLGKDHPNTIKCRRNMDELTEQLQTQTTTTT
ncbi:MAG: tetratricopeptide repeat protein [Oscillospiraceae bacterium]|nr:tetratricopeptide repeat protein [Oscillospiraceae bacterium]